MDQLKISRFSKLKELLTDQAGYRNSVFQLSVARLLSLLPALMFALAGIVAITDALVRFLD